jgi:hypothetical protein
MKRVFVASALAVVALTAHAEYNSAHRWFGDGLGWEEHPCGLRAFAKYGNVDTPEVRRAYELTKQHPEACSKLFP